MQIKPIKKWFFVRLILIWIFVFLVAFAIIIYSVNPFNAGKLSLILFYVVLFCLLCGIFSLVKLIVKIPYWVIILISICIIIVLLILRYGH
jgi:hypothetical protein